MKPAMINKSKYEPFFSEHTIKNALEKATFKPTGTTGGVRVCLEFDPKVGHFDILVYPDYTTGFIVLIWLEACFDSKGKIIHNCDFRDIHVRRNEEGNWEPLTVTCHIRHHSTLDMESHLMIDAANLIISNLINVIEKNPNLNPIKLVSSEMKKSDVISLS